jgi:integrase
MRLLAHLRAVEVAGLGDDVIPHALRHISATWGMRRGAEPFALAGYLGMSLETLLRVRGHRHPDHQREGWGVFDRPGKQSSRSAPCGTAVLNFG